MYLPDVWCDSLYYIPAANGDGIFYSHLEMLKVPVSSINYMSETRHYFDDIYYELTTFLLKYRNFLAF